MKVEKIMTRDVLTVKPDTSIREVARILAENHISGCPSATHTARCSEWCPRETSSSRSTTRFRLGQPAVLVAFRERGDQGEQQGASGQRAARP